MKTPIKRLTLSLALCTISLGCALFILGGNNPIASWVIVAAWAIVATLTVVAIQKHRHG